MKTKLLFGCRSEAIVAGKYPQKGQEKTHLLTFTPIKPSCIVSFSDASYRLYNHDSPVFLVHVHNVFCCSKQAEMKPSDWIPPCFPENLWGLVFHLIFKTFYKIPFHVTNMTCGLKIVFKTSSINSSGLLFWKHFCYTHHVPVMIWCSNCAGKWLVIFKMNNKKKRKLTQAISKKNLYLPLFSPPNKFKI